ncbi:MAG: dihydrodipicolinate synthase family protein [Balneolaceae bacterium]|nr:dihydrodipicolinate synthase family protein [Balneolaceae bacterium]
MNVDWNGIYPAVTTKFNEDGTLDIPTFKKNIEAQVQAGVHGIVLGGTLGEASTLKKEEKLELIRATREVTGDDIPVIVNIAEKTTAAAIQTAADAKANGAAGLMMLPPMQYKADERETVAYYKEVANSTDLPIMVYNNPVDYGIEVTLDMFEELVECDNIQAVKESTRDLTNITRMINRFGDRITILCGVDTLALEALLMGAKGWVAGLVCAFPRETVVIYELAKAGRLDEAREIYRWFMPLLELDINSKLVQNIKLAEVATGLGTEHVRKPRLPLVGKEREQVKGIIIAGIDSRPELPTL